VADPEMDVNDLKARHNARLEMVRANRVDRTAGQALTWRRLWPKHR
jgi:hypothetical protein